MPVTVTPNEKLFDNIKLLNFQWIKQLIIILQVRKLGLRENKICPIKLNNLPPENSKSRIWTWLLPPKLTSSHCNKLLAGLVGLLLKSVAPKLSGLSTPLTSNKWLKTIKRSKWVISVEIYLLLEIKTSKYFGEDKNI